MKNLTYFQFLFLMFFQFSLVGYSFGQCNVNVTSSSGSITITGLTSAENTKLFDANYANLWECNPWGTPCTGSETIPGLTVGATYYVSVNSANCSEWIPVVVQGGGATCTDGIQNQGEEGVDCGGPCPACPSCNVSVSSSGGSITITGLTSAENTNLFDAILSSIWTCNPWGTQCTNSETITGLVVGATYFVSVQSAECDEWIPVTVQGGGATCTDGIQNQGEEDVDCGGPCPACPTCNDGIQNQGEEEIDCGGPCAPCPTGCDVSVSSSGGSITITGLASDANTNLLDAIFSSIWTCNPWNGNVCTGFENIPNLVVGATYYVSVQSADCDEWIPIVVQGGGGGATCSDGIQNQGETGVDCGGPCPACPACDISVSAANGMINVTGLTSAENTKLFDANYSNLWECNPWGSPCQGSETISGLGTGTYYLSVQSDECDEWIQIQLNSMPNVNQSIQNNSVNELRNSNVIEGINVYPSPFDETFNIDFSESKYMTGRFYIYDISGQTMIENDFQKGDVLELNTRSLKGGMYFLRIQTETRNETIKIIKSRL